MPDAGGGPHRLAHVDADRGVTVALRTAEGPSLGTVVGVHGALDGAASFARVRRRLPDADVALYDRRGYRSSRELGVVAGLDVQVDDLLDVAATARRHGGHEPLVVLGHSYGGLVALAAAARATGALGALVVYEPPFPWVLEPEDARGYPVGDDPAAEAETFFRRIVGDRSWERLGERERASRRLDGPALLADLHVIRGQVPFDPAEITLPVVVGAASVGPRRRLLAAERLSTLLPAGELVRLEDASHGAHLSHPDQLAAAVRRGLALARATQG